MAGKTAGYTVVATRSKGQQLLVTEGDDRDKGVILDTSMDEVSDPRPIASILKHHGWEPFDGDSAATLAPHLGLLRGEAPAAPQAAPKPPPGPDTLRGQGGPTAPPPAKGETARGDARVIATRGDGQQLLVVDHGDPTGDARIYDTTTKKFSPTMPFQAILKQGYWQQCKPKPLKGILGEQAERTGPHPDPRTNRFPPFKPFPRHGSREGIDPETGHDAGIHGQSLPEMRLEKARALLPSREPNAPAPPGPTTPMVQPAPQPATQTQPTPTPPRTAGATFHYHPDNGTVSYGPHPLLANQRHAEVGDHVALRPEGQPDEFHQHARVVGLHAGGGVRIRYTASGKHEDLKGPPAASREMQMAPGTRYGRELPMDVRGAHNNDSGDAETALSAHRNPADARRQMADGPQVGMRFRPIHPHADWPEGHPFGDQHEVVHAYPSGRAIVANRATGAAHEMEPSDWHNAVRHESFRPEAPNDNDEHGDHDHFAKIGALAHPEEGVGSPTPDDEEVAAHLPSAAIKRALGAAPRVRSLTDGAHGLQKLLDTYEVRHGGLRSEVRSIEHDPKTNNVQIGGHIHHTDPTTGEESQVGEFQRTLAEDHQGHLVAKHDWLELPAKHQGGGFAQAFNDNAEKHYRDIGVHRSELHADITVGKYAWAQQGYDFHNNAHRAQVWDRFKDWADMHGLTFPKRDHQKLRKTGTAWDLANYDPAGEQTYVKVHHPIHTDEVHVDGHFHSGKAFLLSEGSGGGWIGHKYLDPNTPHQQQAEKNREKQRSKGKIKSFDGVLFLRRRHQLHKSTPQEPPKKLTRREKLRLPKRGGLAMEGRGPRGVLDSWYHLSWLLEHDKEVARAIFPDRPAKLAKALPVAPEVGEPRRIQNPGKRGGHWWYDPKGNVRYGPHPGGNFGPVRVGDHAHYMGNHARVTRVDTDGSLHLRSSTRYQATYQTVPGDPDLKALAPAGHHGNELPPSLQEVHQHAQEQGFDAYDQHPVALNPQGKRARMRDLPDRGDAWAEREGGEWSKWAVVEADHGRDVVVQKIGFADEGDIVMQWRDWQKLMDDRTTRILPPLTKTDNAGNFIDPNGGDDDEQAEEEEPRDEEEAPSPPPAAQDEHWYTQQIRREMQAEAYEGDRFDVITPFDLDGEHYDAGSYAVTYARDDGIEVTADDSGDVYSIYQGDYRNLLAHPSVTPTERGDAPEEEEDPDYENDDYWDEHNGNHGPDLRGDDLVDHVLPGRTVDDLRTAWDGDLPGGFTTEMDEPESHNEQDGLSLDGTIYLNGMSVGRFQRSIFTNRDGLTEVHHDLMMFDSSEEQTNSGFAAAFNGRAEAEYAKWGVDLISVWADISIGKYVWAKQGFDFENNIYRKTSVNKLIGYAREKGIPLTDEHVAYLGRDDLHAWELADFHPEGQPKVAVQAYKYTPRDPNTARYSEDWGYKYSFLVDGEFGLGRAYLLDEHTKYGNDWHGTKYLDPDHPTFRQGQKYLSGKGKK